ncbi:MAG: hypothetical protein ABSB79_14275 [Syntrophales bacterium]
MEKTKRTIFPTFDQVYNRLLLDGPAQITSSKYIKKKKGCAEYKVKAEIIGGVKTIVAYPIKGKICIHADCWRKKMTCGGSLTGGIFNGDPSIYDWYDDKCESDKKTVE